MSQPKAWDNIEPVKGGHNYLIELGQYSQAQ